MTSRRALIVLSLVVVALTISASLDALARALPAGARVVAFVSAGTPERVTLVGRALTDPPPPRNAGFFSTVFTNVDVIESDELPSVPLTITLGDERYTTRTDGDGLFSLDVKPARALDVGTTRFTVQFGDVHLADDRTAHEGTVVVVDPAPGVAVVSDFDDTIVNTYVRDKTRMLALVVTAGAEDLEVVPSASRAYSLARDAGARAFFYVSGSPLALYERIARVLDEGGFPKGPILLKNLGEDSLFAHEEYKLGRIEALLERYPDLSFVLVGDSGEKDPEIYAELRRRHGDRVAAILIRRAPMTDVDHGRFKGMFVVDDHARRPELLADLVRAAERARARRALTDRSSHPQSP